jgi:hypothetical protein
LATSRLHFAQWQKWLPRFVRLAIFISNQRFQLSKRGQLFIGVDNETFSVVAMRIGNEDCSPATIKG